MIDRTLSEMEYYRTERYRQGGAILGFPHVPLRLQADIGDNMGQIVQNCAFQPSTYKSRSTKDNHSVASFTTTVERRQTEHSHFSNS